MKPRRSIQAIFVFFLAWFVLEIGAAASNRAVAQKLRAPAAFAAENPLHRGLDANLYMQTSAEYRACCYQAYNLAAFRLKEAAAAAKDKTGKLAVVMDLDETVLDNAGFQTMMLRSELAYDQRLWDLWEEKHSDQVGLIPGAKEFILEAGKLGVAVFHITNRNAKFREPLKKALHRLGIPIDADEHLKMRTDTSDKTSRRKEVESKYTVLLYLGDNLRDFDEKFRCRKIEKKTADQLEAAIEERKDKVDLDRALWGAKWIILPNPAYGEWMTPLNLGKRDLDLLAPPMEQRN